MIKWDGFGKLLKLSFFGLLTSFFTLSVSSFASADTSATKFQAVGITSYPSPANNQYDVTFLKGGGLLTNFLGYSRNVFALDSNILFFWDNRGLPYLFFGSSYQGYFYNAYSCDYYTTDENGDYQSPSNCSAFNIDQGVGPTIFKNFFSKVNTNDIVYYNVYVGGRPNWWDTYYLCFGSQELNKSLCFSFCNNYAGTCASNLSGSLGLPSDTTFSNLPYMYVGYAPGQNGYMGDYEGSSHGSSEVNNNNLITGDYVYATCTNGYVKQYLEGQGLSKFVCYAGLDINNTGLQIATAGTGSSVFQLFQATNDGNNFSDWFTFWDTQYHNRYVVSTGVWTQNPGLYPYFEFVNQYGGQFTFTDIQDYCRLVVNDLPLTGKFTGSFKYCSSLSSSLGGGSSFDGGPGGGTSSSWGDSTGEVPLGFNRGSGTENIDTISFLQSFFNKAKSVIPTDFSGNGAGILPGYIVLFLIALMLFRFISH